MKYRDVKVTTYIPDNSLKKGYLSIFNEIIHEIWDNRWLTCQLFKRDFLGVYKQSFIGILWAVIIPLGSVGAFILLDKSGVINLGNMNVPYPIYALLGMAFWQLFSAGLVASSSSLIRAGSMIVKIKFSKKSLVLASLGRSLVSFLIQFVLVSALFIWYGFAPNMSIIFIPLLLLPILMFTLGLGFILSLVNGVFRDIGNILSIFLTFLMFLTPILYAKPKSGVLAKATIYNPLYYFVSAPRDLILEGAMREWKGFILATFLATVVLTVCIVLFHLTETRVAERI